MMRIKAKYIFAYVIDKLLSIFFRKEKARPGIYISLDEKVQKKILIVILERIGDAIMTTVIPQIIKKRYPSSDLTIITRPSIASVFKSNPFVDKILLDKAPWWSARPFIGSMNPKYWRELKSTIERLRLEKYEVSIEFRGDLRHIFVFGTLIKAKKIISFARTGGDKLLDYSIPYREHVHEIEKKAELLKPLGIFCDVRPIPRIYLKDEEIKRARQSIKNISDNANKQLAIIDPGGKAIQRWPIQKYAIVAENIANYREMQILITVAPEYRELGDKLIKMVGSHYIRLLPRLDLRTLYGIVKISTLVISSDTGIVHIAKAVGTPTVTLYGPTDPRRFGYTDEMSRQVQSPYICSNTKLHEKCRINKRSYPGKCMLEIKEEMVINEARDLLLKKVQAANVDNLTWPGYSA